MEVHNNSSRDNELFLCRAPLVRQRVVVWMVRQVIRLKRAMYGLRLVPNPQKPKGVRARKISVLVTILICGGESIRKLVVLCAIRRQLRSWNTAGISKTTILVPRRTFAGITWVGRCSVRPEYYIDMPVEDVTIPRPSRWCWDPGYYLVAVWHYRGTIFHKIFCIKVLCFCRYLLGTIGSFQRATRRRRPCCGRKPFGCTMFFCTVSITQFPCWPDVVYGSPAMRFAKVKDEFVDITSDIWSLRTVVLNPSVMLSQAWIKSCSSLKC